jgi:hypothetical protein
MAISGWLRFVCTNGLIIGTALMQLQQQHRQQLEVEELGRRIGEAIEPTWSDKAKFERWMSVGVVPQTAFSQHVCSTGGFFCLQIHELSG